MNVIYTYLFKHKYYNQVNSVFKKVCSKSKPAFIVWCEENNITKHSDFHTKELVYHNLRKIEDIAKWIKITRYFLSNHKKALQWFFYENKYSGTPELHYFEYKFIAENEHKIVSLIKDLECYRNLLDKEKEAIERLLLHPANENDFSEIKMIVSAAADIKENGNFIRSAHIYQKKFENAWKCFSQGRLFPDISLSELKSVKGDWFERKEKFLKYYYEKTKQVLLILGSKEYAINEFSPEAFDKEGLVVDYYESRIENLEAEQINLKISDSTKLKGLILGSREYGDTVHYAEDFTIPEFYQLRASVDELHMQFDQIVDKVHKFDSVIRKFNLERCGKSVVYIQDYLRSVTTGSELYKYIEHYEAEKEERDKAIQIHSGYSKGCYALFGNVNFQTCDIKIINSIIESKDKIVERDRIECEKERIRLEQERLRQEQERKQQELNQLRSCVSNWSCLLGGLHYTYLLKYFPTTCSFEATEDEWADRYTVWNFKNTPGKTSAYRHEETLDNIIPKIKNVLTQSFGSYNLHKLTLVCIPASNQENTTARYQEFSERLCEETGMENSFSRIRVIHEKTERRSGGTSIQTDYLSFDSGFFRDKYVILFDDVITRGDSMRTFKSKMESLGAYVVAGFSIGKTKHER